MGMKTARENKSKHGGGCQNKENKERLKEVRVIMQRRFIAAAASENECFVYQQINNKIWKKVHSDLYFCYWNLNLYGSRRIWWWMDSYR